MELYRKSAGSFESNGDWASVEDFKGLIQMPTSSAAMSNGKATSSVDGVLFCDLTMNSIIEVGDRVQYGDLRYIVSGRKTQPLGVSGVASKRGNHCEFNLEFDSVAR